MDFYSADHKKHKFGKEKKRCSFDFSEYWFGSVRLGTKINCERCSVASQCKDKHLVCFLLMFIFLSLQSCLVIVIISLHKHFSFFWKIQDPFFPNIFNTQFDLHPFFTVKGRKTRLLSCYCHSFTELLMFANKSSIYKFRESLRFTDFRCFISRLNFQHSGVQFGVAESGITPCAVAHRQARSRQTRLNRRKAA